MIIPLGGNQWLHMESNDVITWDGSTNTLTITTPQNTIYSIPQALQKRVIRLLAFGYLRPDADTITPAMAAQMGIEVWTATRTGM